MRAAAAVCAALLLLLLVQQRAAEAAEQRAAVRVSAVSAFVFVESAAEATAWAVLNESTAVSGWDVLRVYTAAAAADALQAYGAGLVEGKLTCNATRDYFWNYVKNEFGGQRPAAVVAFLQQQLLWLKSMVAANPTDAYWVQVGLALMQYQGVADGFASECGPDLSAADILLLNAAGDVETLAGVLGHGGAGRARGAHSPLPPLRLLETDCSALIRVLPDFSNVFATQATWRGYFAMLRTYKFYHFGVADRSSPALSAKYSVSFSSQPAFISSKDDYYVTSHGLVVMETTNNVFGTSLNKYIVPQTVPCWVRSIVANRMATSGAVWTATFARFNSGTYNNQWMVLDYKQIVTGASSASAALLDGALWLAEQIPGHVSTGDVTSVLRQQLYWPSYNIPYFADIYAASGYPDMDKKYPEQHQFSYEQCPRALIFARNATLTRSDADVRALIRYNAWQTDPFSYGSAGNAVASRYDLLPAKAAAFGAIDAKMTCAFLHQTLGSNIISGPTAEGQPVFQWSTSPFASVPHDGVPDRFDFEWNVQSAA